MAAGRIPNGPDVHGLRPTGQGVEEAFTTIVSRVVDAVLAAGRKNQTGGLIRQRILQFVVGRRDERSSKNELLAEFKSIPPAKIMEEPDHLVRLIV